MFPRDLEHQGLNNPTEFSQVTYLLKKLFFLLFSFYTSVIEILLIMVTKLEKNSKTLILLQDQNSIF
jgi:hypothetical protein